MSQSVLTPTARPPGGATVAVLVSARPSPGRPGPAPPRSVAGAGCGRPRARGRPPTSPQATSRRQAGSSWAGTGGPVTGGGLMDDTGVLQVRAGVVAGRRRPRLPTPRGHRVVVRLSDEEHADVAVARRGWACRWGRSCPRRGSRSPGGTGRAWTRKRRPGSPPRLPVACWAGESSGVWGRRVGWAWTGGPGTPWMTWRPSWAGSGTC